MDVHYLGVAARVVVVRPVVEDAHEPGEAVGGAVREGAQHEDLLAAIVGVRVVGDDRAMDVHAEGRRDRPGQVRRGLTLRGAKQQ